MGEIVNILTVALLLYVDDKSFVFASFNCCFVVKKKMPFFGITLINF